MNEEVIVLIYEIISIYSCNVCYLSLLQSVQ